LNRDLSSPCAVFEDPELWVVYKPHGWPCQPDPSGDESVLDRYPGHLITRLDRPVAGLMVIARSRRSAAELSAQLSDGRLVKTYLARVDPPLPACDWTEVSDRLEWRRGRAAIVDEGGKAARLRWRCTGEGAPVEIRLLTGRRHQIRAQLAGRGHPIVGDRRYGGLAGAELSLVACAYQLDRPGEAARLRVDLPEAWLPDWVRPAESPGRSSCR
jgi:23S rRNA pseudouridine1911/1915/1917 synthase